MIAEGRHTPLKSLALALLAAGLLAAAPGPALAQSTTSSTMDQIDRVLDSVGKARDVLSRERSSGSTSTSGAQEELSRREADLERARVDAAARAGGVDRSRVEAMRRQGKSWDRISSDLGISPRVLGLDRDPGRDTDRYASDQDDDGRGKKKGKKKKKLPPGIAKKMERGEYED